MTDRVKGLITSYRIAFPKESKFCDSVEREWEEALWLVNQLDEYAGHLSFCTQTKRVVGIRGPYPPCDCGWEQVWRRLGKFLQDPEDPPSGDYYSEGKGFSI